MGAETTGAPAVPAGYATTPTEPELEVAAPTATEEDTRGAETTGAPALPPGYGMTPFGQPGCLAGCLARICPPSAGGASEEEVEATGSLAALPPGRATTATAAADEDVREAEDMGAPSGSPGRVVATADAGGGGGRCPDGHRGGPRGRCARRGPGNSSLREGLGGGRYWCPRGGTWERYDNHRGGGDRGRRPDGSRGGHHGSRDHRGTCCASWLCYDTH